MGRWKGFALSALVKGSGKESRKNNREKHETRIQSLTHRSMHTLKIIVTKYLRCNVLFSRSFYANANGNGSKQNRQERDCVM